MDRIIAITLGLFIVILAVFAGGTWYTGYTEHAYRSSLASTYTYTFTITTDSPLTNLTLFMPVPADVRGHSPILAPISSHELTGVPPTWKTELFETGKATLVKVTAPALVPPAGTARENPYTITISAAVPSKTYIDTQNPVENSPMFRPVTNLRSTDCRGNATVSSGGICYTYLTALYADYQADPDAEVSIRSSLAGMNRWNIFGPAENEYRTDVYLLMFGEQNGWTTVAGYLETGTGAPTPVPALPVPTVSPE